MYRVSEMMQPMSFAFIMRPMRPSTGLIGVATATALLLGLAGCQARQFYSVDEAQQVSILGKLPIVGPWSQIQPLRCRLLLAANQTVETSLVSAALDILNAGTGDIVFSSTGVPPFGPDSVQWRVDDRSLPTPPTLGAATVSTQSVRLLPGQHLILAGNIFIPPGPGDHQVSAAFQTAERLVLTTPSITIHAAPAQWGEINNGVRLRLASAKHRYSVGEKLTLAAFIHNLDHEPLSIHVPDWAALQIDVRRDLVQMQTKTIDAQYAKVEKGMAWWSAVPTDELLAPGKYRLRLVIESEELGEQFPRAWHGRVVSNDAEIEIAP